MRPYILAASPRGRNTFILTALSYTTDRPSGAYVVVAMGCRGLRSLRDLRTPVNHNTEPPALCGEEVWEGCVDSGGDVIAGGSRDGGVSPPECHRGVWHATDYMIFTNGRDNHGGETPRPRDVTGEWACH